LVKTQRSRRERDKKEKKGIKPMAAADLSKPLNPGWLHLWIIIPHEVMLILCLCVLNAVKQRKISPVKGALKWAFA